MSVNCTRCEGTGFLNTHQIPDSAMDGSIESVRSWMAAQAEAENEHDVQVCDCCGNGEEWYGEPGRHYGPRDQRGPDGPYAYNGGLCECN